MSTRVKGLTKYHTSPLETYGLTLPSNQDNVTRKTFYLSNMLFTLLLGSHL
jgi:hypothetical protein